MLINKIYFLNITTVVLILEDKYLIRRKFFFVNDNSGTTMVPEASLLLSDSFNLSNELRVCAQEWKQPLEASKSSGRIQ